MFDLTVQLADELLNYITGTLYMEVMWNTIVCVMGVVGMPIVLPRDTVKVAKILWKSFA